MSRFLLCSFALVLLYPTAIDLYLVGLPQIASDLNASESQLHIAFSIYLAGMATYHDVIRGENCRLCGTKACCRRRRDDLRARIFSRRNG